MTTAPEGSERGPEPTPSTRFSVVEGTATIDDIDAFVDAIATIAAETGAVVQAFDPDLVVSTAHLERAVQLAARAIARGEGVARDPAVEVLLYAAGRRQIDSALTIGVSAGTGRVVVVAADFGNVSNVDTPRADLDSAVDSLNQLLIGATSHVPTDAESDPFASSYDEGAVREFFDVSDRERAATNGTLEDIVLERVALLDVGK